MQETAEKNQLLIEHLESRGYSATPIDGYKVINNYSNIESELNSLYNGVGLRNVSHLGIIELKGKDVLDYLHRISTNTIKSLLKEGVIETLFTSEKGRIIGLTTLINFEDYQLLVCSRENKSKIISWNRKYVITDDVQVNDANNKYNLLELCGPQADSFITLVCGNVASDMKTNTFKIMHTENLLFFLIKLIDRRGFSRFWLLADFDNSKRLMDFMMQHKGVYDFNLVGEEAFNIFRIEQGIPAAPNELNDEFNPHELGLVHLVDFKKGCYIGQEVIARLDTYDKVQKRITGLIFLDDADPNSTYTVYDNDKNEIGKITSVVYSPKFKANIGLTVIRNAFLKDGIELTAKNSNEQTVKIKINSLLFVK